MKKNLVNAARGLFMLSIFMASAHAQWIKTNWPASNSFFNLYCSQSSVFARTWDSLNGGSAFCTVDNGANWTQISSTDSSIGILSIVMLNDNILAGTWNGFYRSASGGTSWNAVTPTGIPSNTVIWSVTMINNTLFAGAKGSIYKSSDSGATWTEVKSGIPANARILFITASGDAIFAGSDTSGIFMTTNGGTSWIAVNSSLTDKHIFQLAAMGTKLFAVTLSGVFISGNNGTSWAANSSILKDINCFLVVNNQLFAGTDSSGVHLSADSGKTWTSYSSGMPAGTRVWSLAAGSDNIFAGTSAGVWRTPYSIATMEPFPGTVRLTCPRLQFSGQYGSRATIAFALSGPETVDLEVFDLCGNKIISVVHRRFGAGVQSVSFNTRSIAPGSYIMRLTAGMAAYQQTVTIQR
jgi:photosystem II stability/assembly factor-like uncharacterized protein